MNRKLVFMHDDEEGCVMKSKFFGKWVIRSGEKRFNLKIKIVELVRYGNYG